MSELQLLQTDREKRFLLDPYLDWAQAEGPPIHEGFSIDALAVGTDHWPRFDCKGAILHLAGRGDFCSSYVLDIQPGRRTAPIRHLYECFFYVLEGHGSTVIQLPDGGRHSFEWMPDSMFAIPLNVGYQIYNASGVERALLGCVHSLPVTMNLYHNQRFVFSNDFSFSERVGSSKYYNGEGDFSPIKPGRHMWETSFVPNLTDFELHTWNERGAGGTNIAFILADGTCHAHISEIPAARYKKAHRHLDGVHIWAVTGKGYSMLWENRDDDMIEVRWQRGTLYAPPYMYFHQHFNIGSKPARYLAMSMGSRRYPFMRIKREAVAGKSDMDVKKGGNQIEYADQDPGLHRKWLDEIARQGVKPDMDNYFVPIA